MGMPPAYPFLLSLRGIVKKCCKQPAVLTSKSRVLKVYLNTQRALLFDFGGIEYVYYKIRNVLGYIAIEK